MESDGDGTDLPKSLNQKTKTKNGTYPSPKIRPNREAEEESDLLSYKSEAETVQNASDFDTPPKTSLSSILITQLVVVLFVISKTIVTLSLTQYLRYRVQLRYGEALNFSDLAESSACTQNASNPQFMIQTEIQAATSRLALYLSLAANIPSVFTALFLGAYSDVVGRKFLFLIPIVGCVIQSILYVFTSRFELSLIMLFGAEFASGVSGNFITFLLACFAFSTDITGTGRNRTFYIAVFDGIGICTLGLANLTLGYLIQYFDFTVPFIIAAVLSTLSALIVIFVMKESGHHKRRENFVRPNIRELLYNIFKFYSQGQGENRKIFIICLFIQVFSTVGTITQTAIITIYLLGRPICWGPVRIGQYVALLNIVPALGTMTLVKVAQRWLNDVSIAIVSAVLFMASNTIVGLARESWHLYIAVAVGAGGIGTSGMVRSVMSKKVPHGEHGALFASIASLESMMLMMAGSGGNAIYELTVLILTGAVFLVIACVFGVAVILLIITVKEDGLKAVVTLAQGDMRKSLNILQYYYGLKTVVTLAQGDMRKSLNILQSTSLAHDVVDEDTVYTCVGHPLRKDIENIVNWMLNDTYSTAFKKIIELKTLKGLALPDILTDVHNYVHRIDFPLDIRIMLLEKMAEVEYRLSAGTNEKIQLGSLVSAFQTARMQVTAA